MKAKVDKIVKHGVNCFINRQLIYNYPEQLFGEAGVMAIEHADFETFYATFQIHAFLYFFF
jgi:T-complex protein 1 subunit beta